ncbi:hypothetical protein GCM10023087_03990 [Microbacterium rhizosphaerae]
MTYRAPRRPTTRLDFALGVLVALGGGLFLITLGCEITGQPALLWATLTGVVAVVVAILYRRRSRISAGTGGGADR